MKKEGKKPSKIGLVWRNIKRSVLAVHAATLLAYSANYAYNRINPSTQRQEFEQEHQIQINAWDSELSDPSDISNLSRVVGKEKMERPFDLRVISLESSNYFKKTPLQQLLKLFGTGYSGAYNPIIDQVTLVGARTTVLHHEIKHDKTIDVLISHPEFKTEWEALARDDEGNSLYDPASVQFCSKFKGLDKLVKKEGSDDIDERDGFVTSYARTNFLEDIAEIGEKVEDNPESLIKYVYGDPSIKISPNPKIVEKLKLAQKYGLIPSDFFEYLEVKYVEQTAYDSFHGYSNVKWNNALKTIEKADKFVEKNPNSLYLGEVLLAKATFVIEGFESSDKKYTKKQTIDSLHRVLMAPFKDISYSIALRESYEVLDTYPKTKEDERRARIYGKAYELLHDRRNNGDVKIYRNGVNDFLKEQGEL